MSQMKLLHAVEICDLTVDFSVKFRDKHDGASGFL